MSEVLKTSPEWYAEVYPNKEVVILDPDGWDRSNWDYSWNHELITKTEFNNRVMQSTCMWSNHKK